MKNRHHYLRFPFLVGCLSCIFPLSFASAQTQVTLSPSKDNTLYESVAGELSNGAGQHFFVGRTNQPANSIRRALIAFDIAGHIPANSTILSATLTLNMSQTTSTSHTVSLHRVTADWGEGTSMAAGNEGSGAPSTTGDATWLHRFFDTILWSSLGGDFVATPSAETSVGALGTYTWGSTQAMVNDVQQWLNTPGSNFGWLLKGNEATQPTSKRFDSRENTNPALRPVLTVTYQPTLDVGEHDGLPKRFALYQNFPNPFNPSTHIAFDVAEHSPVSLIVTDVLGRKVAVIVNEELAAGRYVRRWDADGMGTGVYFYHLQAGSFSHTRKLLLVR
jgi:hypothetical protein